MEALTMETIERDYPNHWLLVEVTETQDGVPIKGFVLAANSEREDVVKQIGRSKGKRLFFFFNGITAPPETAFALCCPPE